MSQQAHIDEAPRRLHSAAELLAARARALLKRRLAWLRRQPETPDLAAAESVWQGTRGESEIAEIERRLTGPEGCAWQRLIELFGLTRAESDLLSLALAVAAEPALGPMVARAQGSETRFVPTEPLVKRLCGHPARPIWRSTAALAIWGLAVPSRGAPGEALGFEADLPVLDWLFGRLSLDRSLTLAVDALRPGTPPAPEWPVRETARRLDAVLRAGTRARLVVEGRAGSGRRAFGAAVAGCLERDALAVDPAPLVKADWEDGFMRVQRFALFADAAVIWRPGGDAWPGKIPLAPVQVVCVDQGDAPPAHEGSVDLTLSLPEPGVETKAAAWRTLCPRLADGAERLAATPGISLGDLEDASLAAPASVDAAREHLRIRARSRMRGAGRVVDPVFGWDDLILPAGVTAELRNIAFEARSRAAVLATPEADRLFRGVAGLSVLFAGPPGVGKSMAAQIIAGDLGVNLLLIDLAATISKYVGETAKNLSNAFAQARGASAALIFEEADALFARRTEVRDANDRYANADTNHLLQLIEGHEGLVILSTNQRQNIDPALIRRLRHVVDFPKPGPAERRELFSRMLTVLDMDEAPISDSLDGLAASHDLSPAQIKGAVLSARYAAMDGGRAPSAEDLETAASRELTKEGRPPPAAARTPATRRPRRTAHG